MNDILTQEEIDALLNSVGDGDIHIDNNEEFEDDQLMAYDFSSQDRIVRGRMPTLEIINERFARYFSVSLQGLMNRTCDIASSGVQMLKFAEYIHSLFIPASLNLVRVPPLQGTSLFVLEPKLVFALVDNYFGGSGSSISKIEGRDFTDTELRVVRLALDLAFKDLEKAWKPVIDVKFDYQSSEVNPHFASIVSPSDVVVVNTFHIDLNGISGDLYVTLPYTMVEPIRGLLDAGMQNERSDVDGRLKDAVREEMKEAKVTLSSILAETSISLRELNALKNGDVIPVDIPDQVLLEAEKIPLFRGSYGVSNGNCSIKIIDKIVPDRIED